MMSVPLNYIQKDFNGQTYVLIAENDKATRRNILWKEYNGRVEILEGLSDTD
ncbi:MAG: hypothetical protein IPG08_12830 [Sphingobacteriaceae bacterium]|nr:hypothetical protein [Sphingobacteriaceae bacterium]